MIAPLKARCLLWYLLASLSADCLVVAGVHCSGACCAIYTVYGVHMKCHHPLSCSNCNAAMNMFHGAGAGGVQGA